MDSKKDAQKPQIHFAQSCANQNLTHKHLNYFDLKNHPKKDLARELRKSKENPLPLKV